MGKDDHKGQRVTRELDLSQLAALAKRSLVDESVATAPPLPVEEHVGEPPRLPDGTGRIDAIVMPRTRTLADPMTTAMLAEVARRSQTVEFDDDVIDAVLGKIDAGDTSHPHTRRRSR